MRSIVLLDQLVLSEEAGNVFSHHSRCFCQTALLEPNDRSRLFLVNVHWDNLSERVVLNNFDCHTHLGWYGMSPSGVVSTP